MQREGNRLAVRKDTKKYDQAVIALLCTGRPESEPFTYYVPPQGSRTEIIRPGDTLQVDPRGGCQAGTIAWVKYHDSDTPRIEQIRGFLAPDVVFASGAVHYTHIEAMHPVSAYGRRLRVASSDHIDLQFNLRALAEAMS